MALTGDDSTEVPRAGDGNRTRMTSLEGWSSAIELRPHDASAGKLTIGGESPAQQGGTAPAGHQAVAGVCSVAAGARGLLRPAAASEARTPATA